jgi:hypothetical protein
MKQPSATNPNICSECEQLETEGDGLRASPEQEPERKEGGATQPRRPEKG